MQSLWKTVWNFFKKLKTELPYDLAIPLVGIYPKKPKTLIHQCCEYMGELFTIAKIWKQPKCPAIDQ